MQGKTGRPRGTGQVFTIPPVELSFGEAEGYRAGYRLGGLSNESWADDGWLERNVDSYLNAAERTDMRRIGRPRYLRWVMVGIMQWNTDAIIRKIRGA